MTPRGLEWPHISGQNLPRVFAKLKGVTMKSVHLLAATALAFGTLPTLTTAQTRPICAERDVIVTTLATRYGESAVSLGLGPDNRVVEVFASEETGTWTITVTSVNGTTCLVASGDSYTVVAPLPDGEPL